MHYIQQKILNIADEINLERDGLRQIGRLIGGEHPFKVSYHLKKLEEKGLININKKTGSISHNLNNRRTKGNFLVIPILGAANCGNPEILAEDNLEGYIKVSKKIFKGGKKLLAVKAVGNSMNKANINGAQIKSGDYVIVDIEEEIRSNKYVLAIIDDCASLKKVIIDIKDEVIALISESTENHPTIFLHEDDKFLIKGVIKYVIRKPSIDLN